MKNYVGMILISLCALLLGTTVFASEVSPQTEGVLAMAKPYSEAFMVNYPKLSIVVVIMGVLRAVNKPLQVFIGALNAGLKGAGINFGILDTLEKYSSGKVYKFVSFAIDYLASVKVPKKEEKK